MQISFHTMITTPNRLVSAYEDKVLGLSENGEIFGGFKNKTFSQFVDHILKEWKSHTCNEHWQPQYMHCNYCDIDYDIIGRVETLEDDLKYIAHLNNFTSSLPTEKEKLHVHPSGGKRFSPTPNEWKNQTKFKDIKDNKTMQYFSVLSPKQLKELYTMYQLDFEIFGYSIHPYVNNAPFIEDHINKINKLISKI